MQTMVRFVCQNCENVFELTKARVTGYRGTWGKDPMYCSRKCAGKGRQKRTQSAARFVCEGCGKDTPFRRYEQVDKDGHTRGSYYDRGQRFCSQECAIDFVRSASADQYMRGETPRHIRSDGYARIIRPIAITGKREPVYEHRVKMARTLGRDLRADEHVHHVNGKRSDNRPENLELWTKRHPAGQRVIDKVAFAIEILRLYPDFAEQAGVRLVDVSGE